MRNPLAGSGLGAAPEARADAERERFPGKAGFVSSEGAFRKPGPAGWGPDARADAAGSGRPAWGRCGGVAAALVVVLWWLERSVAPQFDEGLALRWVRALADHPWRSGAALALLLVVLTPWRPIGRGMERGDAEFEEDGGFDV